MARLGRSNEGGGLAGIDDTCVACDARSCQECLAALVDGNRLEMAERIAHEIDRRILLRQGPCAFGGGGRVCLDSLIRFLGD